MHSLHTRLHSSRYSKPYVLRKSNDCSRMIVRMVCVNESPQPQPIVNSNRSGVFSCLGLAHILFIAVTALYDVNDLTAVTT